MGKLEINSFIKLLKLKCDSITLDMIALIQWSIATFLLVNIFFYPEGLIFSNPSIVHSKLSLTILSKRNRYNMYSNPLSS